MTRKDYILIAAALNEARTQFPTERPDAEQQSEDDAYSVADALAKDNPRFNRARFLGACTGNYLTGRDRPRS
jgi:hypothetical protein